ncbi:MAG TPA: isoprenylcysteine carboxylmethyltransferase family protein [Ktedonobacteraceae bacterium]|nr:isoprenylcysteine carboxylmethyltransferase family protein [Ktedonobacteraceae bacterium]
MRPRSIAFILLGLFFVTEPLLRQGKAASSRQAGPQDRGSTRLIGATFGSGCFALLAAPLLNKRKIGRIQRKEVAWGGIIIMIAGIVLRVWASRVLGAFYTRTLRTSEQQHLITNGPYRIVRHPGYIATLLMWSGAAISTGNWVVPIILMPPMAGAYCYRIQAEEMMLTAAFPQEYPDYAAHTWRLVPFVF